MSQKRIEDVRGYRISCLSFEGCPVCYGCRAYRNDDSECLICEAENKKINLCKTHIHKGDLVSRFVPKHVIDLDLQGGFEFEHYCDNKKPEGAATK